MFYLIFLALNNFLNIDVKMIIFKNQTIIKKS